MAQAQVKAPTAARKGRAPKAVTPAAVEKVLQGGTEEVTAEQRAAEEAHNRRAEDQRRRSDDVMAFSASQMLAQPETKPEVPVELFQQAVQKLAETMGIPPELVPVPPAEVPVTPQQAAPQPARTKDVKNGVTRPAPDTKCGRIWGAADRLTVQTGAAATIAELRGLAELRDINENTMKTQYARWREYNGVHGRIAKPAQPAVVEGQDEGMEEVFNRRATDKVH